jgi:hypothetical protein
MIPTIAKSQPILIPKGQISQSSRSSKGRTKSPRLNGADLYVVRLGWKVIGSAPICCADSDPVPEPLRRPRPATGSLHDELLNPGLEKPPATKHPPSPNEKLPTVLALRPCYRCISYMASVGIKRVFWTDDAGHWEGAKVRDLVDALDHLGSEPPSDANAALNSVFVTKHEVLMLRRMMGDSESLSNCVFFHLNINH